jgi:hypothetical protein
MAQGIAGSVQNVEIDFAPTTTYKTLVCLRTSSVNTTVSVTEEETNCGKLTSIGEPGFTVSFDAICEVSPSGSQATYEDCLAAIVNKTQVKVRFQNPTVTGASIGTLYYHQCDAFFTDLTLNQDAAGGQYINFSGTLQSTGTLDITA